MKKKLFSLFLILIIPICLLFSGCGINKAPSYENDTGRLVLVYSQNDKTQCILVDKETRVMYLWCHIGNGGGLTAMLNPDGTPMIWEGEL